MHISKRLAIAAAALASFPAPPVFAHHSYTMFDMDKSVALEGTVKDVQWTNPHIWIQLVVKDAATGKETEWSIEGPSPNMLVRAGWTRNQLKTGDKALVAFHPLKTAASVKGGSLASVTVNGQQIFGGRAATQTEEAK
jgi:hypothetical protein